MFSSKALRFCLLFSFLLLATLILPTLALAVVPNTTITINPSRPDGYFGWYRTIPTITLTSDQLGTTFHQWDSMTGPWTTYSGSFPALVGDFATNQTHTLYYYSTSGPDTEEIKFFRFKVDPNLPVRQVGGTCEGCHGSGSYKDQVSFLTSTSHDLPTDPQKAPDRCQRCHVAQMSAPGEYPPPPFLRDTVYNYPSGQPYTVMAENTNRLCSDEQNACHQNPIVNSAYPGKNLFVQTKHFIVGSSGKALTRWPDKNFGFGMCGNCHDPHGVQGTTDYRRNNKNKLCFDCHDDSLSPPKPAKYSYRGESSFNNTEHGSSTNTYNKWPTTTETGGGVGTGGSASGECINCHNPHGKNDGTGNPLSKLTLATEENTCYGGGVGACHSATTGSVSGINILERFSYYPVASSLYPYQTNIYIGSYTAHHDITTSDQLASGGKVECKNCHNPHLDNRTNKMVDPDNLTTSYTATTSNPFGYSSVIIKGQALTQDTKIRLNSLVNLETSPNNLLTVGKDYNFQVWRSLIRFDLSAIPPGVTIDQATLILYAQSLYGGIDLRVHRVTESWTEGGATWFSRDGVNNWASAGGSYNPTPAVSGDRGSPNIYGGENIDITGLVSQWYNGVYPNNGLILIAPLAETGSFYTFRSFYSSEESLQLYKIPTLVVRYYTTPPAQVLDKGGFCLKCHDGALPPGVITPLDLKNIDPIYSDPTYGEFHGGRVARGPSNDNYSSLKSPYYYGMPALPCTECHEPHGSTNLYYLKENINGQAVTFTNVTNQAVRTLCQACHNLLPGHHGFADFQACLNCHYHRGNYSLRDAF